jgi:hypothetical protein
MGWLQARKGLTEGYGAPYPSTPSPRLAVPLPIPLRETGRELARKPLAQPLVTH